MPSFSPAMTESGTASYFPVNLALASPSTTNGLGTPNSNDIYPGFHQFDSRPSPTPVASSSGGTSVDVESPVTSPKDGAERLCSIRGCSSFIPASESHKMCLSCRGKHRVYASTKRAKRRAEKGILDQELRIGGAVDVPTTLRGENIDTENGHPNVTSGLEPNANSYLDPPEPHPQDWTHAIDPRLFQTPRRGESSLAGALDLPLTSNTNTADKTTLSIENRTIARKDTGDADSEDEVARVINKDGLSTVPSNLNFSDQGQGARPPSNPAPILNPLPHSNSNSASTSALSAANSISAASISPTCTSDSYTLVPDAPGEGDKAGETKYCSVKGCKAVISTSYSFKMCVPCRSKYRLYGITKRAKWRTERHALDAELKTLREKEDKRRAERGLPPLADNPAELRAWELTIIDEQVPLPSSLAENMPVPGNTGFLSPAGGKGPSTKKDGQRSKHYRGHIYEMGTTLPAVNPPPPTPDTSSSNQEGIATSSLEKEDVENTRTSSTNAMQQSHPDPPPTAEGSSPSATAVSAPYPLPAVDLRYSHSYPTAHPPLPARMCGVSHCNKILPGWYRYKRCESHRLQNRWHSRLKRNREIEVKKKGPRAMGEMGVTEGAMGNFQPVAGPSSIASAEETPKPIGGEVQSPVNGDGAVVSDGVVKKKRKRRTKAELAEYDRRTEELAALYGNDGESEEVRITRRSHTCVTGVCENLLVPGSRWRSCESCRAKIRRERKESKEREAEVAKEKEMEGADGAKIAEATTEAEPSGTEQKTTPAEQRGDVDLPISTSGDDGGDDGARVSTRSTATPVVSSPPTAPVSVSTPFQPSDPKSNFIPARFLTPITVNPSQSLSALVSASSVSSIATAPSAPQSSVLRTYTVPTTSIIPGRQLTLPASVVPGQTVTSAVPNPVALTSAGQTLTSTLLTSSAPLKFKSYLPGNKKAKRTAVPTFVPTIPSSEPFVYRPVEKDPSVNTTDNADTGEKYSDEATTAVASRTSRPQESQSASTSMAVTASAYPYRFSLPYYMPPHGYYPAVVPSSTGAPAYHYAYPPPVSSASGAPISSSTPTGPTPVYHYTYPPPPQPYGYGHPQAYTFVPSAYIPPQGIYPLAYNTPSGTTGSPAINWQDAADLQEMPNERRKRKREEEVNRGKEEARLMQTKWRINEPITTATPAPAQPPPAPESQARPSELQGHPPENSVTSVTTLGERGTEDQSPDAEQLQENSNNDVEKSAARPCGNKSCHRAISAGVRGTLCEKCRIKIKKMQNKTKQRFRLEPKKVIVANTVANTSTTGGGGDGLNDGQE